MATDKVIQDNTNFINFSNEHSVFLDKIFSIDSTDEDNLCKMETSLRLHFQISIT